MKIVVSVVRLVLCVLLPVSLQADERADPHGTGKTYAEQARAATFCDHLCQDRLGRAQLRVDIEGHFLIVLAASGTEAEVLATEQHAALATKTDDFTAIELMLRPRHPS